MAVNDSNGIVVQTLAINDHKAGMQGLDKERINRLIHETSKGTNYFEHQLKRQQRIDKRAKEMESSLQGFSENQLALARKEMDALAEELEADRDLNKFIVHIDMDAFYAAIEIRDDPSLAGIPVAVGSNSMLSTSNYEARAFGIRAAMPGFIAKKLCPHLVIVPPNFSKYTSVSEQVMSVLQSYAPVVSMMSLDEAYLDITEYVVTTRQNDTDEGFGEVADLVVERMRKKIYKVTGLTASAGIAPNTMLAKVCSDRNKPNGQFRLNGDLHSVREFISELPIRKISGIGPVQDQLFSNLGITTCHHLWERREILPLLFTYTAVHLYLRAAMGLGSTCIQRDWVRKSIGTEESFREIDQPAKLYEKCQELCRDLTEELEQHRIAGKVVVLKLKNVNFEVTTRNLTLGFHTSDGDVIFGAAKKLLEREIAALGPTPLRLRLIGVRLQTLVSAHEVPKQSFLSFEKEKETQSQLCPICGYTLPRNDLGEVNNHIDNCLSRRTIKEMLSTEKSQTTKKADSLKRKRANGFSFRTKKSKTAPKSITSYFQVQT